MILHSVSLHYFVHKIGQGIYHIGGSHQCRNLEYILMHLESELFPHAVIISSLTHQTNMSDRERNGPGKETGISQVLNKEEHFPCGVRPSFQNRNYKALGQSQTQWITERVILPTVTLLSGGAGGKERAWNAGDAGSTPGSGRSPAEGHGYRLQYPCLENTRAWRAAVHGVAKSQIWLKRVSMHTCIFSLRIRVNSQ